MLKNIVKALSFKWFFGLTALFIVTLCISIIYHLPINWLLAQPSIQKQLPSTLQLSPSHGTLWEGNTQVSTLTPNLVHLGKVDWQLSFGSLFIGQAQVQTVWQKEQSHLNGELNIPLFSETGTLNVSHLNGKIELPLLIQLINAPGLNDLPIEGELRFKQIDLSIAPQSQWPSVFSGNLILNNLSVLGNTFPSILITPELKGEQLTLNLSGGESGWALSGQLKVLKNRQYTIALKVTAQSQGSMPDWAGLLRQQSPTVAVLNNQGRW